MQKRVERRLQGAPRVDVVEQPLNGPLKDIHALAGWYSRAVKAVAATGNDEWAWKEHRFRLAEIFRAQSREWSNIALCVKKNMNACDRVCWLCGSTRAYALPVTTSVVTKNMHGPRAFMACQCTRNNKRRCNPEQLMSKPSDAVNAVVVMLYPGLGRLHAAASAR